MITHYQIDDIGKVTQLLGQIAREGALDENVRHIAEQIADPGLDESEKRYYVQRLWRWVRQQFPYINDPVNAELFIHPSRIAEDYMNGFVRALDCDDFASLMASLASSIGIKSRVVIMDSDGDGEYDHAICQVWSAVHNDWITVDTSSNVPLGWDIRGRKVVVEV